MTKKARGDLQAQWFYTLPDYFKQKADEARQKAKIKAMLRLREKEEELSGIETMTDKYVSKIVSEPDTCKGIPGPNSSIPPK